MYTNFFGLSQKPFNLAYDPHFQYLGRGHKEAIDRMNDCILEGGGFFVLRGCAGIGKTTISKAFLSHLTKQYRFAYVANPAMDAIWFLKEVNREQGIPISAETINGLEEALFKHLKGLEKEGKKFLLLIDEAQNISPEILKQIRILASYESEGHKLAQIILVGEPELDYVIENESPNGLKQKISFWHDVSPLSFDESVEYVNYRINAAGWKGDALFTDASFKEIYKFSKGVPRLINQLCERALLLAYAAGARELSVKMIKECIRNIGGETEESSRLSRVAPLLFATICIVVLWAFVYQPWRSGSQINIGKPAENKQAAGSNPQANYAGSTPVSGSGLTAKTVKVAATENEEAQAAKSEGHYFSAVGFDTSVKSVLAKWEVSGIPIKGGGPAWLHEIASSINMRCFIGKIDEKTLVRLNYPAILVLNAGHGKKGFLPVIGVSRTVFQTGAGTVERKWALNHWTGETYIFWKNFTGFPRFLKKGDIGDAVKTLQANLASIGYLNMQTDVTGTFGARTESGVIKFQKEHGLTPDGQAGELTTMLVYNLVSEYNTPHLSKTDEGEQ
jgi:general secretion pathway protein A